VSETVRRTVWTAKLMCSWVSFIHTRQLPDGIITVLMQPGILDDTAVLQFAKTHKLITDWPAFLRRIVKCLLLVPMKVNAD
jgi:hypothetical protein